jgi:hypothetical protein
MRIRAGSMALMLALLVALLLQASPANAYPSKTHIIQSGWTCFDGNDNPSSLWFNEHDRYFRTSQNSGNYRYNRDLGKINFRTGPWEQFFGKLVRAETTISGWGLRVKRDSDGTNRFYCGSQGFNR